MKKLFIWIYFNERGVEFMKHFKGNGRKYKRWETSGLEEKPSALPGITMYFLPIGSCMVIAGHLYFIHKCKFN
jgi:hypothetical protein